MNLVLQGTRRARWVAVLLTALQGDALRPTELVRTLLPCPAWRGELWTLRLASLPRTPFSATELARLWMWS